MKFPSPYLSRPAGCCCLLCVLNIYSFIAVYLHSFIHFARGKPAKGFSIFSFVLGRLPNSYTFMQGMLAKIYRRVCIHSAARGIIAWFSRVSNTKLRVLQHGWCQRKSPPWGKVARRPDEGRVRSTVPQRRSQTRPPLISPLRGQLLPGEKPFGQTLSPSPAPPERCSSVSSPRPRRGSLRPDQTTSHSRSPTAAR